MDGRIVNAADPGQPTRSSSAARPMATVLFMDLVMFTSLTDIHGDAGAADAAATLEAISKESLGEGSRLVNMAGDGALIAAESPTEGLRTAKAIVERLHEVDSGLDARGGLDHGPVVARRGDLFGSTVNRASRLAEIPAPGQLAMTRAVAEVARDVELAVTPLGFMELKGFHEPVEVFGADPCRHDGDWIIDPVCGMRLRAEDAVVVTSTGSGEVGFCSQRCAELFATTGST